MTSLTPEQLDKWRWEVACAIQEQVNVSGFDPKKTSLELTRTHLIIREYRRLVVADERPAQIGKVSP